MLGKKAQALESSRTRSGRNLTTSTLHDLLFLCSSFLIVGNAPWAQTVVSALNPRPQVSLPSKNSIIRGCYFCNLS